MMCSADSWGIGGQDVGSKDKMSNFSLLIRIALPEVIDGVVSDIVPIKARLN